MKAKKAQKRLNRIDALITDLTEHFSKGSTQIRAALQDAKSAFARLMAAVSSQAPCGKGKTPKAAAKERPEPAKPKASAAVKKTIQAGVRRRSAQKKKATSRTDQVSKKAAPTRKKAVAAKTVAPKTATVTAKKRGPMKKAVKRVSKKKVPAPVQTAPTRVQTTPGADVSSGQILSDQF